MTLEQVEICVAVAQRQHVTQTAKALALEQSAVSAAAAALEAQHIRVVAKADVRVTAAVTLSLIS